MFCAMSRVVSRAMFRVMSRVTSRVQLAVMSAAFSALALVAVPDHAFAQAGCQPTIMQPCTNVPPRTNAQAPNSEEHGARR